MLGELFLRIEGVEGLRWGGQWKRNWVWGLYLMIGIYRKIEGRRYKKVGVGFGL